MNTAAEVTGLAGSAHVLRGTSREPLAVGSVVGADDILSTEPESRLELRFADNALVQLGPSAKVEVRDFIFHEPGQENSFVLNMMQGAVRSVSGTIVKENPEAFMLTSPMGTVGIRGTTTMHLIKPGYEVHAVTSLDRGHTVVIHTADGRVTVISDTLKGVVLTAGDLSPLKQFDMSPQMLEDYFQVLQDEGRLHSYADWFFAAADAQALAALGEIDLKGHRAFLPIEAGDDLEYIFGDLGRELSGWLPLVLNGDSAPGMTTILPGVYIGTTGDDHLLTAPGGSSTLFDLQGNDRLESFGGQDVLVGGYGSSDTLIKNGVMTDGNIFYGDGSNVATVDPVAAGTITGAICDNDRIIVTGDMTGGEIYGDAYQLINCTAGNDLIFVDGEMSVGKIYGDAFSSSGGTGGNDFVSIQTLSGGEIHLGDGNDTLAVRNFADGGTILLTGDSGHKRVEFGENLHVDIFDTDFTVSGRTASVALPAAFDVFAISGGSMSTSVLDASARTVAVSLFAGGTFTLLGGSGNDTLSVGTMTGGTVDGQGGADFVNISSQLQDGTVNLDSYDRLRLQVMDGGTVNLNGAAIDIRSVNGGTVNFNGTSAGTFETLNGGLLQGSANAEHITIRQVAGGTIDVQGGNDTIDITRIWAGVGQTTTATITLGPGDDSVRIGGFVGMSTVNFTDFDGAHDTLDLRALGTPVSASGGTLTYGGGATQMTLNFQGLSDAASLIGTAILIA